MTIGVLFISLLACNSIAADASLQLSQVGDETRQDARHLSSPPICLSQWPTQLTSQSSMWHREAGIWVPVHHALVQAPGTGHGSCAICLGSSSSPSSASHDSCRACAEHILSAGTATDVCMTRWASLGLGLGDSVPCLACSALSDPAPCLACLLVSQYSDSRVLAPLGRARATTFAPALKPGECGVCPRRPAYRRSGACAVEHASPRRSETRATRSYCKAAKGQSASYQTDTSQVCAKMSQGSMS